MATTTKTMTGDFIPRRIYEGLATFVSFNLDWIVDNKDRFMAALEAEIREQNSVNNKENFGPGKMENAEEWDSISLGKSPAMVVIESDSEEEEEEEEWWEEEQENFEEEKWYKNWEKQWDEKWEEYQEGIDEFKPEIVVEEEEKKETFDRKLWMKISAHSGLDAMKEYAERVGLTAENARSSKNFALEMACLREDWERVKFLVEKGLTAEDIKSHENCVLKMVCYEMEKIKFLMEKGLVTVRDLVDDFEVWEGVCEVIEVEMLGYLIEKGLTNDNINLLLRRADGYDELNKFLDNKGLGYDEKSPEKCEDLDDEDDEISWDERF